VFEVASVKENKTADRHAHSHIYSSSSNGEFTAMNVPMEMLMGFAFAVPESRILNAPAWFNSVRFDIEAKAETSIDEQLRKLTPDEGKREKQTMLQALLADRFQLRTHTETRELPVYWLVVAKGGAKLSPNFSGNHVGLGRGSLTVQGGADSVAILADRLGQQLGRIVVNKTGISGSYDLSLKWSPDVDGITPPADSGPSIFTAIQEQLGLKLESAKDSVPVLVIDHVDMPSEN
jgi:uncharacterized protein (TIGR03435 family)